MRRHIFVVAFTWLRVESCLCEVCIDHENVSNVRKHTAEITLSLPFSIKCEDCLSCSRIAQCYVFMGRFSSRAKQRVEQAPQISFRKKHSKKLHFVIYVLYSWWWKHKLLNKLHRSLVTLGGIIIFSTTMRQEGSGWNADRFLPEVVYSY